MSYIKKINWPGGSGLIEPILYSVSSQENNSDVIKANIPGFELTPGVVITLKIPNITNTGTKIEINNNSGQIKNIKYNNANIRPGFLLPNYFYSFLYAADETWNLIGTITANDVLDYDYEYFPNGFANIGEVASLSSSGNATYTKNDSPETLADPGDLVYIIKKKDENGGNDPSNLLIEWYACYEENNLTQWLKLIPKSIRQSNKLITERTLYYYEGNENISKLGTITQGTWNGTPVDVEHGGTNNTSVTLNGILYGSSSTQISSKVPSWKNWITNAINGPKAVIQLGDRDYISDSIPAANTEISGIITTTNQSFLGTKTFVNNSLWLKNNSTNINKILFGANTLNDLINNYKINDTGVEWASINLRIPSIRNETTYNTQFSFRQLQISQSTSNEENETGLTIFSPGSNYEEYFLPVVDSALTTNKNYDILTTKFTVTVPQGGTGNVSFLQNSVLYGNGNNAIQTIASADGALFATSINGTLQWGTLPIAQGGTGATTLFAAKANLGFGVAAHDFTLSNFLELDQHWGIGAVVQSAEVAEGEDDKDFLDKKTFLILTNSGLLSYNNTDDEKIWEFNINSSDITATVYNTPNETDPGVIKASYKILYKSNDANAVGSSTSPIYIDENGEATACGSIDIAHGGTNANNYNDARTNLRACRWILSTIDVLNQVKTSASLADQAIFFSVDGASYSGAPTNTNWYDIMAISPTSVGNATTLLAHEYGSTYNLYIGYAWRNGETQPTWKKLLWTHETDMPQNAANFNTIATANTTTFYRNGFIIPSPATINDGGFLRVRGTAETDTVLELGTWDDSGSGETIQFNYYPTTSQITPTYSVSVPKASGTICLTNGTGASGTWGISISGRLTDSAHSWSATEVYNYMVARVLKAGDTMTGQLYINYAQDVGLNQNGSLVIGPKTGENIGIDNNEIMARNNSAASTLYINSEGGNVYIGSGGITSVGTITSSAGYLKSTLNSNTVQIGSQNTGFCHITNSAAIPFWFNQDITMAQGKHIGQAGSQYRPFQLYLGRYTTAGSNAINSNNPLIEFSNSDRSQYGQLIYSDYDSVRAPDGLTWVSNQANSWFQAPRVFGAVWNDYAEYRETKEEIQPGRCIVETGKGDLILSTQRLQPGCEIVSDTFGFAIGETDRCKTPTACAGRVLAYLYEDNSLAHPGDPVCSGPNGTVSLMTHEEEIEWPSRIIATVSEIPDYEEWEYGSADEFGNKEKLKVNGRIWIRVR